MYLKIKLKKIFLLIIAVILSSCDPAIFSAKFDLETVGSPPSISPPGEPTGDEIYSYTNNGCNFKVIESEVFNSKALKYNPVSITCGNFIYFKSKEIEESNDFLMYYFEYYRESLNCLSTISLTAYPRAAEIEEESSTAMVIFFKDNGQISVSYESGPAENLGTYRANQKMAFIISMRRSTNTFDLSILRPGEELILLDNKPITSTTFWGKPHYQIGMSYAPSNCNDSPTRTGAYVVDNVVISKEKFRIEDL